MTFDELTISSDAIRMREPSMFEGMTNDEIEALMRGPALEDMKRDVSDATGIAVSDTASLDAIAERHESELLRALAYLQLALYCESESSGPDSMMHSKAKTYRVHYGREQGRFPRLVSTSTHMGARFVGVRR